MTPGDDGTSAQPGGGTTPMVWVLVTLLGLGCETCLIIALGRRVTRRYETAGLDELGTEAPLVGGRREPPAPQRAV
jgi:hypothetical protein